MKGSKTFYMGNVCVHMTYDDTPLMLSLGRATMAIQSPGFAASLDSMLDSLRGMDR